MPMRPRRKRHLLVFDTAYTYKKLLERNITTIVTARDHDGWFDHVWTVHPIAAMFEPDGAPERYGRPVVHSLAPRHTFIEGKFGRFSFLRRFEQLNLLLAQLSLLSLLVRVILKERIDLIRSEEVYFCGVEALLIARLFRIPLLVGVWGNPGAQRLVTGRPLTPRLFRTIGQEEAVERFVLRRADAVMVQNEDNRNYVLGIGIPKERTAIFRLGNAIERRHFDGPSGRPRGDADLEAIGAAAGRPTLLVISRLDSLKLPDHAIRAVKLLADRKRSVTLLMAGEGPMMDELVALAQDFEISDNVKFLGNRDQDWLFRVMPAVTMVVATLAGRALAEAALGAAPIVAYDIDWHRELIETGVTGQLVPYRDVAALADAIERYLDDSDYALRMGGAVRQRVLDMMDPDLANRDQVSVYRRVMQA